MGLQLYDSMSGTLKRFEPYTDEVKVYSCGITPYDTTHLGHAFTYTSVDILIRYLRHLGYSVRYTQNVTDIDDDILRKSKEVGRDWYQLGNEWTQHFISDIKRLNVLAPASYPRATEVIPEIIESVQELIEAGIAYQVEGSVYYEVDRFPEFGKLSKIPRAEMLGIANERGNNPADPNKRDPLDFVLWQAQQEDEPGWESPWGIGRPGWHIECSTMSNLYLGKTIDIHAGGYDLIFPHHECEIAQIGPLQPSEPFVRYWMHIAMVYHEGQKMSKSLGNLIMISDLLQEWESNVIRLYLANHHYRSEWSYDIDKLNSASERADLYAEAALAKGGKDGGLNLDQEISQFEQAMNQDLNSPQALVVLDRMAEMILEEVESGHADKNAQGAFTERAAIFGLKLESGGPSEEVVKGWDKHLERFPA